MPPRSSPALLGIIIFVDDYFNCLTVGAVMRPVDGQVPRQPREARLDHRLHGGPGLALSRRYSSWAVAVGGYMGEDGFNTFVASIPYNFYALLTIFFVFFMLFLQKDFGPMAAAQADAEGRIPAEGSALEAVSLARIADKAQVDLEGAPNIPTVVTEEGDIDDAAAGAIEEYKGLNISIAAPFGISSCHPGAHRVLHPGHDVHGRLLQRRRFRHGGRREPGHGPVHRRGGGAVRGGGHVPAAQAHEPGRFRGGDVGKACAP